MSPGWPRREDLWAEVRGCLVAIPLCLAALILSELFLAPIPTIFILAILIAGLQESKLAPYFATIIAALLYYAFILRPLGVALLRDGYTQLTSLIIIGCTSAAMVPLQRNPNSLVTDNKRAPEPMLTDERHQQTSIETLSDHAEAIPGLIYIRKPDGTLEPINHRMTEFSNIPFEVMLENDGVIAIHPDDRTRVSELCRLNFSQLAPFCYEFRHLFGQGSYRWVIANAEPLKDERGEVVRWYTLLTEIEDRKAMEKSLRRAQAKLAEASRISTVAELTASVAHEISQPLSGIIANAQACLRYLAAKPIDEGLLSTCIQRILRDGRDASQTVRDVRALFHRKHPEARPIDLHQVINEVLLLHEARIGELGIAVKTAMGKDIPPVPADRLQIQQLLANLIRNAIESMESSPEYTRELELNVRHETNNVFVAVADTGVGLSNPDKLFDPFFTTKESGMGMGLCICKTIVEAHEGRLWADARPSRGATFTFSLPLEGNAV